MFFILSLFSLCFFLLFSFMTHYMLLLLFLEGLLLSIFLLFCFSFLNSFGLEGLLFFLLLMVCMGGFSVALLVNLSRCYGRDFWVSRFIF